MAQTYKRMQNGAKQLPRKPHMLVYKVKALYMTPLEILPIEILDFKEAGTTLFGYG